MSQDRHAVAPVAEQVKQGAVQAVQVEAPFPKNASLHAAHIPALVSSYNLQLLIMVTAQKLPLLTGNLLPRHTVQLPATPHVSHPMTPQEVHVSTGTVTVTYSGSH